jgi:hypothetical protein
LGPAKLRPFRTPSLALGVNPLSHIVNDWSGNITGLQILLGPGLSIAEHE